MVFLPLADSPVSHIVRPDCRLKDDRIVGVTGDGWYVMLLAMFVSFVVLEALATR